MGQPARGALLDRGLELIQRHLKAAEHLLGQAVLHEELFPVLGLRGKPTRGGLKPPCR